MNTANKKLIYLGFFVVALLYLLQLPTPLRVNWDGVYYLNIGASFYDHHVLFPHATQSHFPSGYPFIIATLERLGCARSLGFVAWNFLMLAAAAVIGIRLLRVWLGLPASLALLIALLSLLGWATMRYALIVGSEPTYIAISFLSLLCLSQAESSQTNSRWARWILAFCLIPPAMQIRSVGFVLLPAAVWALIVILWRGRKSQISFHEWIAARKGTLLLCSLVVVIVTGLLVIRLPYSHEDLKRMTRRGFLNEAVFTEKQRCMEMTSLLFNIPSKNVLEELHRPEMYLGIPCLALILLLILRRLRSPTAVDAYLILYTCVLLLWPYDMDVRFWLPVQLLIFGIIARELLDLAARLPQKTKLIQTISGIWVAFFAILGLATFAWNSRLSYSGKQFGELWDLHSFRDTYRIAFHNGLPADPSEVHPELLNALQRYGQPYSTVSTNDPTP